MSHGTSKDLNEVCSVNLGYVNCVDSLSKSLWWITRDFTSELLKIVLIVDKSENYLNFINVLNNFSSRTSWTLLAIDGKILQTIYQIDSLRHSKSLAYKVCDTFCGPKKIVMSSNLIYGNNGFKSLCDSINHNQVKTCETYMIPKYVQEGLTEMSSNFCEYLAKECRKFPVFTIDYPPKNIDYVPKFFIDNEEDKEVFFTKMEAFYLESDASDLVQIELDIKDDIINKVESRSSS